MRRLVGASIYFSGAFLEMPLFSGAPRPRGPHDWNNDITPAHAIRTIIDYIKPLAPVEEVGFVPPDGFRFRFNGHQELVLIPANTFDELRSSHKTQSIGDEHDEGRQLANDLARRRATLGSVRSVHLPPLTRSFYDPYLAWADHRWPYDD